MTRKELLEDNEILRKQLVDVRAELADSENRCTEIEKRALGYVEHTRELYKAVDILKRTILRQAIDKHSFPDESQSANGKYFRPYTPMSGGK